MLPSIEEGQKEAGSSEECPLHLLNRFGNCDRSGVQLYLPFLWGGQVDGLVGKMMFPFSRGLTSFPRCG